MRAVILTVGSELLDGRVADTNAQWAAGMLDGLGAEVAMALSVGDEAGAITDALDLARERGEVVWITGGMGPTRDDLTVATLARFLGRGLAEDGNTADRIRGWCAARKVEPDAARMRQALVPAESTVFPNPAGTAPGILVEDAGTAWIVLPGVPAEMKAIAEASVLPWLGRRAVPAGRRTLLVAGMPESDVDARLAGLWQGLGENESFALEVGFGEVRLAMKVRDLEAGARERRLDELEREVRERLGDSVCGTGDAGMAECIIRMLGEKGASLATAESVTGGMLASRLTSVPGASRVFSGGWVTYTEEAKEGWLGIEPEVVRKAGPVSAAVTSALADAARKRGGTAYGAAVTGWAGPDGGTAGDPVGTVYVAVAGKGVERTERHLYRGGRGNVREFAVTAALVLLRRILREEGG